MTDPFPHVVRRGEGAPLLFVHGNGVDHRLLLGLDPVFAASGRWERIYLDLAGFGRTRALEGRAGLPDLADWLDGVVDSLIGSAPFAVVGNSLGGLLARDIVSRRPKQCLGMALLAPAVDPVRERRRLPEPEVLFEDPRLLASLDPRDAADYAELAVLQTPDNWARFRDAALPGIRAADEGAMGRLGDLYELPAFADDWESFERPVLIVAGKQDAVVGHEDQRGVMGSGTAMACRRQVGAAGARPLGGRARSVVESAILEGGVDVHPQ
ncbi:alpha/beta hydrolase [Microbacterium bovistercoris]|uniref:Alpha/beta hydrolase n=1 Tax=Microbacterium bovistercoris TaxID=2293570 RepID=A0A371NSY9_9MICO|nr:alpha/beta hydrolase [Microbacterium bovistercoris]REJ05414.1 alpha/beta hydrolase [Microbacterium bovistercoris]